MFFGAAPWRPCPKTPTFWMSRPSIRLEHTVLDVYYLQHILSSCCDSSLESPKKKDTTFHSNCRFQRSRTFWQALWMQIKNWMRSRKARVIRLIQFRQFHYLFIKLPELFKMVFLPETKQSAKDCVAGLNQYLEKKRLDFPRFFFLSNDRSGEVSVDSTLLSLCSSISCFTHERLF